ncbi:LemA family protein [Pseudomonas sp. F1_0610]|uniref:LemA family protein n=1 Tax=Pseudomonas sp. F1_0610 TaxID=3114284 RepID=UPI0039C46A1B
MTVFLIILVVIAVFGFMVYNNVVAKREAVISSESMISVQLDRRGKVFDSLINVVKKYMEHENSIFTRIAELRAQTMNSNASQSREAQDELSKIVNDGSIKIALENYPELRSNENVQQLQEEIVSTENKLAFAKSGYNNTLETYKAYIASFPAVFVVKFFPQLVIDKDYWRLDEARIAKEEERRVEL